MDFEPVRQHAKCEEEDGKAEKENSRKDARGEPDLTGERRDEFVLRKAVPEQQKIKLVLPPGRKVQLGKEASLRTFYELVIRD